MNHRDMTATQSRAGKTLDVVRMAEHARLSGVDEAHSSALDHLQLNLPGPVNLLDRLHTDLVKKRIANEPITGLDGSKWSHLAEKKQIMQLSDVHMY